ncbi:hypothetical protein [Ruminiclostridium josui]|uniref:hypothetical protein n=1 Tax=Ruminiclostridium josui TaxID=1499 RepID=UPI0013313933|nr:hypothetical protein [Ruminiclostridium josui]
MKLMLTAFEFLSFPWEPVSLLFYAFTGHPHVCRPFTPAPFQVALHLNFNLSSLGPDMSGRALLFFVEKNGLATTITFALSRFYAFHQHYLCYFSMKAAHPTAFSPNE